MEIHSLWETIKIIVPIIMAIVSALWFFLRKYILRIEILEERQNEKRAKLAVVESKLDDVKDDIKEIKHDVARLVDRKVRGR